VGPWNVTFSEARPEHSPRAAHAVIAGKVARTLAREILAMSQEEFGAAFEDSPMKRAKLRGVKRNAAVALGNVGSRQDVDALTHALDDDEPLVREQTAWALTRLRGLDYWTC